MPYFLPDLTGSSIDYAITDTVVFFKSGQEITFPVPVFKDTIHLVTTASIPVDVAFSYGLDDDMSMSDMKKLNAGFNATLVRSITIAAVFESPLLLMVSAQGLYPTKTLAPIEGESIIDVTPTLLTSMLYDINSLKTLAGQSAVATLADSYAAPLLLDTDITGNSVANLITDEGHLVDTFQTQNLIVPGQGSFYGKSLVIRVPGIAEPLTPGIDYSLALLNPGKTSDSTSDSAVYDMIVITYPYAGMVYLNYQAFGGDVTRHDVERLNTSVSGILAYLSGRNFLTVNELASAPIVSTLNARIAALEEDMRALMNAPRYTGVTSGTTAVRKLQSLDADFHWWTIGQLYKVTGSDEVFTAAMGSIRIAAPQLSLQLDVDFGIDLSSSPYLSCTVNTYTGNTDPGFTIHTPRLRLIWDSNTSGAYLQLGLRPSTALIMTIAIEDKSGNESEFLLTTDENATLPSDSLVTLPDGTSMWILGDNPAAHCTIAPKTGYPVASIVSSVATLITDTVGLTEILHMSVLVDGVYKPLAYSYTSVPGYTEINFGAESVYVDTTDGIVHFYY